MRIIYIFVFFILLSGFNNGTENSEIKLEGTYQGENIYIMNPFAQGGVGFCIYEVTVNGQVTTDELNSSAFEIDLSIYNFKHGDKVTIVIKYKKGCTPKVLNPEVLNPKSTFKIVKISVNRNGTLNWTTTGEKGKLPFFIQQFRWKKWINIAAVNGKGTPGLNNYSVKVSTHSGVNKFRVKQVDYTKRPRYSPEATFRNLAPPVTFSPGSGKKASTKITFSQETKYEIYDYYGRLVLKGTAKIADITKLKKGSYFLNYDNQTDTFEKK